MLINFETDSFNLDSKIWEPWFSRLIKTQISFGTSLRLLWDKNDIKLSASPKSFNSRPNYPHAKYHILFYVMVITFIILTKEFSIFLWRYEWDAWMTLALTNWRSEKIKDNSIFVHFDHLSITLNNWICTVRWRREIFERILSNR